MQKNKISLIKSNKKAPLFCCSWYSGNHCIESLTTGPVHGLVSYQSVNKCTHIYTNKNSAVVLYNALYIILLTGKLINVNRCLYYIQIFTIIIKMLNYLNLIVSLKSDMTILTITLTVGLECTARNALLPLLLLCNFQKRKFFFKEVDSPL